jgi:hypothetical protein
VQPEGRVAEGVFEESKCYTIANFGLASTGRNFTFATEHCEPFYDYSTAPLDQQRLKQLV